VFIINYIIKSKFNLKFKNMRKKSTILSLKLGFLGLLLFVFGAANAQRETSAAAGTDFGGATTDVTLGASNGSVKLVDSKGTVKYIQTKNGLTSLTDFAPGNGGVVTTFQLGGQLTDDTYIDRNAKVFALDGLELATGPGSINAVTNEVAKGGSAAGTGFTLLVRDEATGAVKKLPLADLIDGGFVEIKVATAVAGGTDLVIGDGGLTATLTGITAGFKTSVYRNGIKLNGVTDQDYEIVTTAGSEKVTLKNASFPFGFPVGDVIAIQWIK
jgi:hypothetical protein